MAQPTRSDVHVNKPLTNISIAYIQNAKDFVADKVFPIVPVMKQADRYFTYDKKSWFRTEAHVRAPASESAGSGFTIQNTPSYYADVWAVHKDVDDQIRANADQPLDMDRDSTLFVTQQLLLRREKEFVKNFVATGIWQGFKVSGSPVDFAPATNGKGQWDSSTSNPMQDIDNLKQSIKQQTGYMPNTLLVSADVFFALRNNAAVLDRIKYTQTGIITEQLLASLFGVEKFLVTTVAQDLNPEGETNNMNYLVSNSALLCYSAPSPSILQPSGGYIFSWQGLFGAGAQGNRIMTFRMEHKKSDRIEGEMSFAMKLISPDVGVYLTNVLAVP
jgi:hypothetical protein